MMLEIGYGRFRNIVTPDVWWKYEGRCDLELIVRRKGDGIPICTTTSTSNIRFKRITCYLKP